jgi:hypothetical protein
MGPDASSRSGDFSAATGAGGSFFVRGKGHKKKGKKSRAEKEEEKKDTYDAAGRINLKGILVRLLLGLD